MRKTTNKSKRLQAARKLEIEVGNCGCLECLKAKQNGLEKAFAQRVSETLARMFPGEAFAVAIVESEAR